jgi:hypothetical protein
MRGPPLPLIAAAAGRGNAASELAIRYSASADDLDLLEPLWGALQAHHASILPTLGDRTPPRSHPESWDRRREKYEGWLSDDETFHPARGRT